MQQEMHLIIGLWKVNCTRQSAPQYAIFDCEPVAFQSAMNRSVPLAEYLDVEFPLVASL